MTAVPTKLILVLLQTRVCRIGSNLKCLAFCAMIVPVAIGELVECEWCSALMANTEVDVLCVVCASSFADRLLPPSARLWNEEIPPSGPNGDFEDSKYRSELAEDDRSEAGIKESIHGGTGGIDEYDNSQPHCAMYEKMASVWHLEKEAIPLSDNAWAMQCHLKVLSRCWLDDGGSLVKFGFPEIRALFRNFIWDAPMGFVIINLARRKTFSISTGEHVEQCRLKSAIHYLRDYPDSAIGFVFSTAEIEKQQISIIQVAKGPWAFADNTKWHWACALAERMVKLVISKYKHVSFWNGQ